MLTVGSIMLVLHVWWKRSPIVLLSPLHLLWMQRAAYIWPHENEQASHCIGAFLRNGLLQLVQRLYVLPRMPNYCWSALKKWGNVRFVFLFSITLFLWCFTWRKNFSRSLNKSLSWRPWAPNDVDINLLLANPKRRHTSGKSTIGLRGLMNLGSTCFMNCIVQVNRLICIVCCVVKAFSFQALIHTPLLRDYFFAERHECSLKMSNKCLVCEMSRVFQVNDISITDLSSKMLTSFFFVGILFRNSWTIVTASTITFNLDTRTTFSWLWATGCTWVLYSHTRRITSTLQKCQIRGGKNRAQ